MSPRTNRSRSPPIGKRERGTIRYRAPAHMISQWKRRAQESLPELFAKKADRTEAAKDAELKELHAKIGKLTVENDFLSKAFGR